eukprot:TRINITY_DN57607_c0_g1_i1.p1 TRINITY_DN57607_c0_g1~~TRINITY_DN57607_c0_g1_i1.p1  ORF type:complete len:283 (+),score=44.66 TRINITY_DN57607_c0_g1_i1:84-932(+)
MSRAAPSSFDKIFARDAPGSAAPGERGEGDVPTVHELFSAVMRNELGMRDFAQALAELHNIGLTPAAVRLLASVDATSGRLSFAQFQRALQDNGGGVPLGGGAGLANQFQDQAAAIITDNSGQPVPVSQTDAKKANTDISADAYVRQHKIVSSVQANRGAFSANPVRKTNTASAGNPLAPRSSSPAGGEQEEVASREALQTATRIYVGGELSRGEYEGFLTRFGVDLGGDSDLQRLIASHEQVGDGNFIKIFQAVKRELAKGSDPAVRSAAVAGPAAGVRSA